MSKGMHYPFVTHVESSHFGVAQTPGHVVWFETDWGQEQCYRLAPDEWYIAGQQIRVSELMADLLEEKYQGLTEQERTAP